ncbi:uncharacterized protein LOC132737463 isoform X2 [Ruditapes philippinarum]|nr:uncharacterized protein LOC132737463 isoform X2 [Ruditapes philippinarum]
MTWFDAKGRGNFATPNILVNSSTFIVNISTDLNDNEEVWVGYFKKGTAFAYIGCGFINNAKPTILLPESRNSPGLCYSMCNKYYHQYIGLNKDKCFCMKEKPIENISLPECDISPNGTWVAGGGSEYMSIYERLKTEMNVGRNKDNEECLIFESNYRLWWSDCHHSYLSLCLKGNSFTYFVK